MFEVVNVKLSQTRLLKSCPLDDDKLTLKTRLHM